MEDMQSSGEMGDSTDSVPNESDTQESNQDDSTSTSDGDGDS